MNIPQLRSEALRIENRINNSPAVTGVGHLQATVYRLANLVEDVINVMDESEKEKGILVSEVSIASETWRTYLTKRASDPKKEEKKTKRQRALDSLIKYAESLDW